MIELLAVAVVTILAVVSPGADFAMVTRNSLLYGRPAGLLASLGIAAGVQLHVLYTMLGVGLVLQSSPVLFSAIKLAGALYLIYVGYQTFFSRISVAKGSLPASDLSAWNAFRTGFLTNALNPKTTLFVVSVYTQVVNPGTSLAVQIGYGLFMSLAHWVWFSMVSLFFSEDSLRHRMLQRQVVLNRSIGLVLVGLGLALVFAPSVNH
jgi:RhtB (resistance to homoserine/threonine) family protein